MNVTIFNNEDIKKRGGFKKKNHAKTMTEETFIKHIIENDLNLSKGYIDNIGFISDNNMFKCNSESGIIIGVTGTIDKWNKRERV